MPTTGLTQKWEFEVVWIVESILLCGSWCVWDVTKAAHGDGSVVRERHGHCRVSHSAAEPGQGWLSAVAIDTNSSLSLLSLSLSQKIQQQRRRQQRPLHAQRLAQRVARRATPQLARRTLQEGFAVVQEDLKTRGAWPQSPQKETQSAIEAAEREIGLCGGRACRRPPAGCDMAPCSRAAAHHPLQCSAEETPQPTHSQNKHDSNHTLARHSPCGFGGKHCGAQPTFPAKTTPHPLSLSRAPLTPPLPARPFPVRR